MTNLIKRWLPHPMATALLLLLWLFMTEFSVGQLLLGSVLAVVISVVTNPFWLDHAPVKKPGKMLRYLGRLLVDIFRSNVVVALQILLRPRQLKPAFITYPLTLTDDFAVTLLASTVSLTPGTVSAHYNREEGTLLIHCLNLHDEQAQIDSIRQRYEQPLQEIFND